MYGIDTYSRGLHALGASDSPLFHQSVASPTTATTTSAMTHTTISTAPAST